MQFVFDPWALEIREKGIVTGSSVFHAWHEIRAHRWEEGKIPILVLQLSGWGSCRFGVAPEQKSIIQELLQDRRQTVATHKPEGSATPPSSAAGR